MGPWESVPRAPRQRAGRAAGQAQVQAVRTASGRAADNREALPAGIRDVRGLARATLRHAGIQPAASFSGQVRHPDAFLRHLTHLCGAMRHPNHATHMRHQPELGAGALDALTIVASARAMGRLSSIVPPWSPTRLSGRPENRNGEQPQGGSVTQNRKKVTSTGESLAQVPNLPL